MCITIRKPLFKFTSSTFLPTGKLLANENGFTLPSLHSEEKLQCEVIVWPVYLASSVNR